MSLKVARCRKRHERYLGGKATFLPFYILVTYAETPNSSLPLSPSAVIAEALYSLQSKKIKITDVWGRKGPHSQALSNAEVSCTASPPKSSFDICVNSFSGREFTTLQDRSYHFGSPLVILLEQEVPIALIIIEHLKAPPRSSWDTEKIKPRLDGEP